MKQILLMGLVGLMVLTFSMMPSQANFVQCPGGTCDASDGTSNEADLINGTPLNDTISGLMGNDVIFGHAGRDSIFGNEGNDFIFGGLNDDFIFGHIGNDILLPGPDTAPDSAQAAFGDEGNDTTNVFASEISGCLAIVDASGSDIANLIGFGPYSAISPFGQSGFGDGYVIETDPIAGGLIVIEVVENGDSGVEKINGLINPNVTIVAFGELPQLCQSAIH